MGRDTQSPEAPPGREKNSTASSNDNMMALVDSK